MLFCTQCQDWVPHMGIHKGLWRWQSHFVTGTPSSSKPSVNATWGPSPTCAAQNNFSMEPSISQPLDTGNISLASLLLCIASSMEPWYLSQTAPEHVFALLCLNSISIFLVLRYLQFSALFPEARGLQEKTPSCYLDYQYIHGLATNKRGRRQDHSLTFYC